MAEDRKDSKHHPERTITEPPFKQPLASQPPQSTDFLETAKLPGYVAWLQLQYQQLETAIANMSGGSMSRLAYPQANTQSPPQFLSPTAAPTGLENPYYQVSLNSPFANQQWMDNRAPQAVPPTSPEARPVQNMQYSTELPTAYNTSSPDTEYLMLMAQQSMMNAAGGGQDRQTTVDHAAAQAQFGGEQQLQRFCKFVSVCAVPYMVMPLAASLCHCVANCHSYAAAKGIFSRLVSSCFLHCITWTAGKAEM